MAQEQVRQFIDQATQSIQGGQFDGALSLIDQALALAPDDADAHILRGICLSQTGQPAAATEAFNRAVALDPNSAKARYNLAVHQYALGQKLDALARSREAIQIDPSHAGAKQLVQTLEAELAGPSPQGMPNPNDPLSVPPPVVPPVTTAPQANPYGAAQPPSETPRVAEPGMPSPPPSGPGPMPTNLPPVSNPYAKSGYAEPAHSLPFVENMGSAWVAIGWFFAALSLLGFIIGIVIFASAFGQFDPNKPELIQAAMEKSSGLLWISRIAGFGSLLGIVIWSIMDLIDRRGNFVWLIPNVLCSCCGFGWITLPIYILAGRNK